MKIIITIPDWDEHPQDYVGEVADQIGEGNNSGHYDAERHWLTDSDKEITELMDEAQKAADAAHGDSNDEEIEYLQGALDMALSALGLKMPEGQEPEDD